MPGPNLTPSPFGDLANAIFLLCLLLVIENNRQGLFSFRRPQKLECAVTFVSVVALKSSIQ